MRMASDAKYRAREDAEAAAAIEAALERLKQRERHAREIVAARQLERQALADEWRAVWSRKEILESLGGTLTPLAASEKDRNDLIDGIVDPDVSAHKLSLCVDAFLVNHKSVPNATKKLSELVTAKALWFTAIHPIALTPGPKADSSGADSPDYTISTDVIGDNFRVEGVSNEPGWVELEPDPKLDSGRMTGVIQAIGKGIADKVRTYYTAHLKQGKRLVVTVDVSDCPWVLEYTHLDTVWRVVAGHHADEKTLVSDCLHSVYFVADGHAHRTWPRTTTSGPQASQPAAVTSPSGRVTRKRKAGGAGQTSGSSSTARIHQGPQLDEELTTLLETARELLKSNPVGLLELDHVLKLFAAGKLATQEKGKSDEEAARGVLKNTLGSLISFLKKYDGRVLGDFVKRFKRAAFVREDVIQALGEIEAAIHILSDASPLGAVTSVEALAESTEHGIETPEFRVQTLNGPALVEVKTVNKLTVNALKRNLRDAIGQVLAQAAGSFVKGEGGKLVRHRPGTGEQVGLIIVGEPSGSVDAQVSPDAIFAAVIGELVAPRPTDTGQRRGIDIVRHVEVTYTSARGRERIIFTVVSGQVTVDPSSTVIPKPPPPRKKPDDSSGSSKDGGSQ